MLTVESKKKVKDDAQQIPRTLTALLQYRLRAFEMLSQSKPLPPAGPSLAQHLRRRHFYRFLNNETRGCSTSCTNRRNSFVLLGSSLFFDVFYFVNSSSQRSLNNGGAIQIILFYKQF